MIKNLRKKGFTIVELVIVIAVIAILAAVLIPTFTGIIKKANVSADTQLVRNLNTALAEDKAINGEHKTMQSALDAAAEGGYIVERINAKATGNEILWDSVADAFCYLNDGKVEYTPDVTGEKAKDNEQYKLWKIASVPNTTYSTYLYNIGETTTFNDVKTGIDVGNENVTSISYVRTGATPQEVVIRTNSTETSLTVNGPSDDVKHYGIVGDLTITAVRFDHCYHEYGFVEELLSFGTGKFVVESTALFHQTKAEVAAKFEGKTDSYVEGKDPQYTQHIYDENGTCVVDGCHETTATHAHSWGEYAHDDTNHWRVCASCGAEETAAEHTFDAGSITKAATCTETGTRKFTCTACKYEKTEEIAALEHDFQWVVDTPATKTSEGKKHEKCSRCDETRNLNTVIPAESCDHMTKQKVDNVAATCTTAGAKEYWHCQECNKNFEDEACQLVIANVDTWKVIPALGHNFTSMEHDEHQHWNVCSRCSATDTKVNHTLTYTNDGETHTENCATCGYTKSGLAHVFTNGVCVCGKQEVTIKNGLVNGYYYLNNELYTGTITDNNKTIEFENGCLVVWAEDSLQGNGPYVVNHTFNKSSVDSKYLTDKIVLSSISSVLGNPGSQTFVSNKININFEGYSVESAKACDPSIMYSLSSTPWNNATVYADYMKLISETCGNNEYGDASTFPFYIGSKDYTEYQSLSVSGLTFTDYLKLKYVSNVIVTSSTTAIETYMIKNGSEDKLSAYAYDNGKAGMGIILSKDGNAYFYSWSDLVPGFPSYTNISSDGKYSGDGYSVYRNGATIVVSYNNGTTIDTIDTLTITKNVIDDFNLAEQKAAISTKSIADSCSKEELLALATDLGNKTQMRIDQAPEVMELFIKAFWSTYSFSNASGGAACSFDNFNATTLNNYSYKYVVQFVNGIGNAYQQVDHVGPIIKVIISKN